MANRPEWVRCIRQTHEERKTTSWCGRPLPQTEWTFVNIDHAANARHNKDRLLVCPKCAAAVTKLLKSED